MEHEQNCSPETLRNRARQAAELAEICDRYGEQDGKAAMQSIQRALEAEAAARARS